MQLLLECLTCEAVIGCKLYCGRHAAAWKQTLSSACGLSMHSQHSRSRQNSTGSDKPAVTVQSEVAAFEVAATAASMAGQQSTAQHSRSTCNCPIRCSSRAADLDQAVITSSDNDVRAVLAKADSIHIVLMGPYPQACLHHQSHHKTLHPKL